MIGDNETLAKPMPPAQQSEMFFKPIYQMYREGTTKQEIYQKYSSLKNGIRAKLRKQVDHQNIDKLKLIGSVIRANVLKILDKQIFSLHLQRAQERLKQLISQTYFHESRKRNIDQDEEVRRSNIKRREAILAKMQDLENELNELDSL